MSSKSLRPRIRTHLVSYIEREAQALGTDDLGMVVNRMLEDHLFCIGSLENACVSVDRNRPPAQARSSSPPSDGSPSNGLVPAEELSDEYADLLGEALDN